MSSPIGFTFRQGLPGCYRVSAQLFRYQNSSMKIFGCWLLLLAAFCSKAQPGATDSLRNKALTLRRFLEQQHYQPVRWNDTTSRLLYNKWIKELDEEKIFLTQQDLNLLEPYQQKLDDELLGKGWEFYARSVAIYRKALQRSDSIIRQIMAKPLNFTLPDKLEWPAAFFAANTKELTGRWEKYLKEDVLSAIINKMNGEEKKPLAEPPADFAQRESIAREKVKRRELLYVQRLLKTPALFARDLSDKYLDCIAWCYDPHTNYMNQRSKNAFESEVSAIEYSAGLEINENEKGDKTIGYLQPGGSAWRSGQLHKGDQLVKVKSDGVEKNVADMESSDELNEMLGGSSQSDLELTVVTNAGETKTVKLAKEKISDEEGIVKSYVISGTKNIGYINLPGFYSREEEGTQNIADLTYDGCANDVSKEIVKLRQDSISGLILDLRYNGGGSMWEAMQLAGIFIDYGPVASAKDKTGKVHFLKDPNRGTIYDGPLIVLVNGASASASEFLSAALQDYNRALVVGGVTYGKGTAQTVLPMDTVSVERKGDYEDFVKVTQEKFYRVNGTTTQWKGVLPDIELPDEFADETFKEKSNASALLPDNSKTGIYQALPALPVAALQAKSAGRVNADPYFKTITEVSRMIREYRTGTVVPLQWKDYVARQQKLITTFGTIETDTGGPRLLKVLNNKFDASLISLSTHRHQEVNQSYLEKISRDAVLKEACEIMLDWISK